MKSVLVLLTLSALLLLTASADARKDPSEYWRDVMKDQPVPEVIQDLLPLNPGSLSSLQQKQKEKQEKYDPDLYLQSSLILYHKHQEDKIPKNSMVNHYDSHLDVGQQDKKS